MLSSSQTQVHKSVCRNATSSELLRSWTTKGEAIAGQAMQYPHPFGVLGRGEACLVLERMGGGAPCHESPVNLPFSCEGPKRGSQGQREVHLNIYACSPTLEQTRDPVRRPKMVAYRHRNRNSQIWVVV